MTQLVGSDWSGPTAITVAGLASLANAGMALSSTIFNNRTSAARWRQIKLDVSLTSFTPSATLPILEAALVPSLDGTNFASIAGGTWPLGSRAAPQAAAFMDPTAAAKRVFIIFIDVEPLHYKILFRNGTGATLPASGTVVNLYGSTDETR